MTRTGTTPLAAPPAALPATPGRLAWRRFRHQHLAMVSLVLLVLLVAAAVAAPGIAALRGIDPGAVNLMQRFAPPSWQHPLGTDELGRDLLMRLLAGGRISLLAGGLGALAAAAIGTVIGLLAGFHGGRLDALLMRMTDAVIALPLLPLLIVLAAIDLDKLGIGTGADPGTVSLYRIVVIVALFGWTTVARLVRGAALALRQRDFVLAAEALGVSPLRIMAVHILPNLASPLIVATTLAAGHIILFESVLSFLGLGIQPPLPSWGNMLSNAQETIWSAPAVAVWPGLLIFLTVMACNLLGDGLQHALDPRAGPRVGLGFRRM